MRVRVWSEFLSPDDVCKDFIIDIFKKYNVCLNYKVEYMKFTDEFYDMLRLYNQNNIPILIWTTLSNEMGYWINEDNVDAFGDYVHKTVDNIGIRGLKIQGLCIDMEPPFQLSMKYFNAKNIFDKLSFYSTLATKNLNKKRYAYAKERFIEIADYIRNRNLESFTPIARETYYDVLYDTDLLQNALETPIYDIPWDKYNLMCYGTVMRQQLKNFNSDDIDYLIYRQVNFMREKYGERICVSVGLANKGKLETEPYYTDMEDYYRDIGVIKACGIDDITIFSLDGLMDKDRLHMFIRGAYEAVPYTPHVSQRVIDDEKKKKQLINAGKLYYKLF